MIKEQTRDLNKIAKVYDGESSTIYKLDDGRLYKEAKPILLSMCAATGVNYERKLLSTHAATIGEIVNPITVAYTGRYCTGFTMSEEFGPNLNTYDDTFTLAQRSDLYAYANLFSKIESVVQRANKVGVVMPDLCTCDNIIIKEDGTLKFIDFDGMQFGKNDRSIAFSTSLKHMEQYLMSRKFTDGPFHFTRELDITSLTILMFLVVFNIDLNKVGMFHPYLGRGIALEDMFEQLGLDEPELLRKVKANLSLTERGTYIGDELRKIADKYTMTTVEVPKYLKSDGSYIKSLKRK